jgi:hypothetical protein
MGVKFSVFSVSRNKKINSKLVMISSMQTNR